jgi:hypothetical protein
MGFDSQLVCYDLSFEKGSRLYTVSRPLSSLTSVRVHDPCTDKISRFRLKMYDMSYCGSLKFFHIRNGVGVIVSNFSYFTLLLTNQLSQAV